MLRICWLLLRLFPGPGILWDKGDPKLTVFLLKDVQILTLLEGRLEMSWVRNRGRGRPSPPPALQPSGAWLEGGQGLRGHSLYSLNPFLQASQDACSQLRASWDMWIFSSGRPSGPVQKKRQTLLPELLLWPPLTVTAHSSPESAWPHDQALLLPPPATSCTGHGPFPSAR